MHIMPTITKKKLILKCVLNHVLVSPLKKLEWLNEPLQHCIVGKVLPAFGVQSSAFLTDTLQLICHGK